uniref:hypothetical protein n=1 Tax=Escherichia coli TaxID=562 RepID=UPI001CDAD64A
ALHKSLNTNDNYSHSHDIWELSLRGPDGPKIRVKHFLRMRHDFCHIILILLDILAMIAMKQGVPK